MALEYGAQAQLSVPVADVVTNVASRDVVGNKADAAQTVVAATRSIMAYVKGLLGFHTVPTLNVVTNDQMRDVVGNKTDTPVGVGTAVNSIVAYVKGLLSFHVVPVANTVNNVVLRDVVGNKTDAAQTTVAADKSIAAYVKGVLTLIPSMGLTAKQQCLLGTKGAKGFIDNFDQIANGAAPSVAFWGVIADTGTALVNTTGVITTVVLHAGPINTKYILIHTSPMYVYSLKGDISEIHFKCRFKMDDFTAVTGLGLISNLAQTGHMMFDPTQHNYQVGLNINNDAIVFISDDGAVNETTDATPWVTTQNTYYTFEVVLSATSVKFYINGTLRATHVVRIPSRVQSVALMAGALNGAICDVTCSNVEIWTE